MQAGDIRQICVSPDLIPVMDVRASLLVLRFGRLFVVFSPSASETLSCWRPQSFCDPPTSPLCFVWGAYSDLCEFAERRKFYTEYVHFWSLEYGVFHGIRGIRVEYGRIQASGRSFGIRGKRIHRVGSAAALETEYGAAAPACVCCDGCRSALRYHRDVRAGPRPQSRPRDRQL